MNNKEFDHIVREKMKNITEGQNSSDWEFFSELLRNQEGFKDIAFDKEVNEKIKSHKTEYNSEHWVLLKNRLEKEERIHRHIFISKTLELLAVFLLIFTGINFVPNQTNKQSLPPLKLGITDKNVVYKEYDKKTESISSVSYRHNPIAGKIQEGEVQNLKQETPATIFEDERKKIEKPDLLSLRQKGQPITVKKVKYGEPTIIKDAVIEKARSKKFITPVLLAGAAVNSTPANVDKNLIESTTLSTSWGAGVLFSNKMGRSEIETGLIYNRRSYRPQKSPRAIIDGRNLYIEEINKITYDIVTLPLHFKYFTKSQNAYHPYFKMGIDVNLLMNVKYNATRQKMGIVENSPLPRLPIADADKPEGFINNGSFSNNVYLTFNTEVGIERKLNPKNYLSAGIAYSKYFMIDGLGPNRDKYDAIYVMLGLKHSIN